jgi:hypothetical protein
MRQAALLVSDEILAERGRHEVDEWERRSADRGSYPEPYPSSRKAIIPEG